MRNTILTLLLLAICFVAFGQKKIQNNLSDQHQNIVGTKISLLVPDGFSDGLNFLGLQQKERGSSIMVLDIPGPYSEASKGITIEGMLSQGVFVKKIKTLTVNGLPATYVSGRQSTRGNTFMKHILVFGSEEETIMINGSYPKQYKKTGKEIKKSILSVYYNADKIIDPFEVLDFTLDVSDTRLKFGKSMGTSLIYTADGKVPTMANDKIDLVVAKSISELEIEDKKSFSTKRLMQMPLTIDQVKENNEITIDGLQGHEVYAEGRDKKTDEKEYTYQVILFSDQLYYIFLGTTNDESGEGIKEIKKAIQTFKLK